MTNLRPLFKPYIGEDKVDEFAIWAFGPNCELFSKPMEFMNAWNRLHGNKYHIYLDSTVIKDVPEMVKIWKDEVDECD